MSASASRALVPILWCASNRVTSSGAQVTFALEADERKAHLNKLGQAYGTYRE